MTLFEVLIVVAILAMVSGGIAVAALRFSERAKVRHATTEARTIRTAVQFWVAEGLTGCPSFDLLREQEILEQGTGKDPWGEPYRISCEDRGTVGSSGPDRRPGNQDDIVVPLHGADAP